MRNPFRMLGCTALLLAACGTSYSGGANPDGYLSELPEGVLAIAAPYQDLTSVKINEADGCYVYRHVGPVETTFLPLRATNGRPICSRPPEEPTPAG